MMMDVYIRWDLRGALGLPFESLSFLSVMLLFSHRFVVCDNLTPRGVPLSRAALYNPQKDFSCLDGSKMIPFSFVNDDYCDCADGSDEPGTSACSRGKFYCQNVGHLAAYIPSNRVNDNICDCCDGSDEEGTVSCPNVCEELGRAEREEAERQAKLAKEGFAKRQELTLAGKEYRKTQEEAKAKLENERQALEAIKEEKQKIKEEAEKPEKEALDRYRQLEEEKRKQEEEAENAKNESDAESLFAMLDSNGDERLTKDEMKSRQTFDKNKDGEVSDDEALFFLNMEEEMSKEDFLKTGYHLAKPFFLADQGMFQPPMPTSDSEEENENAEDSLTGREVTPEPPIRELSDDELMDQDHEEQFSDSASNLPGVEEELYDDEAEEEKAEVVKDPSVDQPTETKYDEETQRLVDEAEKARSEFNEADKNVREVVRQLEEINEILNLDFGDDERFAALLGQCFDFEDREYVYTICPFKSASQKPKQGGSEVSIGKWNSWTGPENNKYAEMLYDRGQSCWNGPTRSVKVQLQCGIENRLLSVSEPSRCVYSYEFSTPAACADPGSHTHDEL